MFHYELGQAELRRLRQHPALPRSSGQRQEWQAEYLDTSDRALIRQGLQLSRVRQGWEWSMVLEQQNEQGGWGILGKAYCGPSGLDFSFVTDKKLKASLRALGSKLQSWGVAEVHQEHLQVDTVAGPVGVSLERINLHHRGQSQVVGRLSLDVMEGDGRNVHLLARALLEKHSLCFGHQSLVSLLAGLVAEDQPVRAAKAKPTLPDTRDGGEAFCHIARNCIQHLSLNLPGLQTSDEPEFVHQARVAIRRLRSALKLFGPWLPESFVQEFSERWRIQANALGDCRNLDVFLGETLPLMERDLPGEAVMGRLRAAACRKQRQARKSARQHMNSHQTRLLLLDFEWALLQLRFQKDMPSLKKLARKRLLSRARQVTCLGEAVCQAGPEARHELRIAFKKLRYALEFFASLFDTQDTVRYLAGLVDLQEVLGHLNDLATAELLVDDLLPATAARQPRAWLAARSGLLVEALPEAIGHFLAVSPPWAPGKPKACPERAPQG